MIDPAALYNAAMLASTSYEAHLPGCNFRGALPGTPCLRTCRGGLPRALVSREGGQQAPDDPGVHKHGANKPASMGLTPILRPPPGSPKRRAVPRKFVAFGKYVTICVPFATQPRLSLTATAGKEPQFEVALV